MKSNASSGNVNIPRHVGIIMDGNGRWASKRLLPRTAGHRAGVKNITEIISVAFGYGVRYVTLYVFSAENAGRPESEVSALIELMRKQLKPMTRELTVKGARVVFSGDLSYFPDDVRKIMTDIANENVDITAQTVNLAVNYSGRAEIVRAAALAAESGVVTAESIEKNLYSYGFPELDLIIRTGGEKRLSNFMLYQSAYSELFFTDTLWPDFGKDELLSIFDRYSRRSRKFGKL